MSTFSHMYEERLCRVCKGYDRPYRDGAVVLFNYGYCNRQYAHAQCMVEKWGKENALGMLRDWERPLFKKALKRPIEKGQKHPLAAALKRWKNSK